AVGRARAGERDRVVALGERDGDLRVRPRLPVGGRRERRARTVDRDRARAAGAVGVAQVQRVAAVGRDVREADGVLRRGALQAGGEAGAGVAAMVGGELGAALELAVLGL